LHMREFPPEENENEPFKTWEDAALAVAKGIVEIARRTRSSRCIKLHPMLVLCAAGVYPTPDAMFLAKDVLELLLYSGYVSYVRKDKCGRSEDNLWVSICPFRVSQSPFYFKPEKALQLLKLARENPPEDAVKRIFELIVNEENEARGYKPRIFAEPDWYVDVTDAEDTGDAQPGNRSEGEEEEG